MFTKIFQISFTILIGLSILFGIILPYLISSDSDGLVTLGFVMILAVIYCVGSRISKIVDTGASK